MDIMTLPRAALRFLRSMKLTVWLLALSMVLVLAGTLAQIDKGIWVVVDQYFRCVIAWIDVGVFFPRAWPIPDLTIPFPGGFLIGFLLLANLLAVHGGTFRIQARGARLAAGLLMLGLGVLVTAGVMLGWGTSSVAATENDAFWRVFLRLGRGTLASLVLYGACVLLYKKRAGIVLLHAGILFLMIGEFATAMYAVEGRMTIVEGETVSFIDQSRELELACIDVSAPEYDTVTVIPDHKLRQRGMLDVEALPFTIRVVDRMINSSRPTPLTRVSEARRKAYPRYTGYGERLYVTEVPEVAGTSGARNAPAVDVELIDRSSGETLGRYILSVWFYPNFVNRAWDMPTTVQCDGREFKLYYRMAREYLTSPSGNPFSIELLDFVHERYEGTDMPKDFASQIVLRNEGDQVERELRIWMNNPLRYARRTFYQSGYLRDDSGTVLQVVRNDTWMIPYLSCMIVFVGIAAQFTLALRRDQRRQS